MQSLLCWMSEGGIKSGQTNKQTNKHANKQTNKQKNKQANKQTSKPTTRQPGPFTVNQVIIHSYSDMICYVPNKEVMVVTKATHNMSKWRPDPFFRLFSFDIIKRTVMF